MCATFGLQLAKGATGSAAAFRLETFNIQKESFRPRVESSRRVFQILINIWLFEVSTKQILVFYRSWLDFAQEKR